MIYVVLGMHKSGTTLISQILHHSGIDMVGEVDAEITYDQGNKYERQSILALNIAVLNGKRNNGYGSIDLDSARPIVRNQRTHMRELISRYNKQYQDWGFKDPRTCEVYPLWRLELPQHKIIAIYRSHLEIWPRYRKDKLKYRYFQPYWAWQFVKYWCEYNNNILTYVQQTKMDYLVLAYRNLMSTNDEFERLQKFVDKPLTDKRRTTLYRSRPQEPFMLKIATYLVYKQTGLHPGKITEQFEALRQET